MCVWMREGGGSRKLSGSQLCSLSLCLSTIASSILAISLDWRHFFFSRLQEERSEERKEGRNNFFASKAGDAAAERRESAQIELDF